MLPTNTIKSNITGKTVTLCISLGRWKIWFCCFNNTLSHMEYSFWYSCIEIDPVPYLFLVWCWQRPKVPVPKMEMFLESSTLGSYPSTVISKVYNLALQMWIMGTSLAVQWLRLHLPVQEVWVWFLVGELDSHSSRLKNQTIKQKQYYNIFNKH